MTMRTYTAIALILTVAQAYAAEPVLDRKLLSIGAGVAINSVGSALDDEIGLQLFAAYKLDKVNLMQYVATSVEFGYMDYGFSNGDDGGLWVNGVVSGDIKGDSLGWLARLGYDFGDDNGIMLGGGLSFGLNTSTALRVEYVIRDHIDSLQANLIYRL